MGGRGDEFFERGYPSFQWELKNYRGILFSILFVVIFWRLKWLGLVLLGLLS